MRILFLIAGFFIISFNNIAQNYNMANGSDTTCSGTFYDNGGLGLYTANQNLTKTFCSNTAGSNASVTFTTFMTQAVQDELCIYDGPTTASTLIGCYSGTGTLNGRTFTSTTGCLTFKFTSNSSTNLNGWAATLSCKYACQPFTAVVDTITPIPDTSALKIIRLCNGTTINFSGSATFPLSGTYYNQSIATSTFKWKTGDGFVINGATGSHTFNISGNFDVNLIVTDTIGCESTIHAARVKISLPPKFTLPTYLPNDTICFEDTAIIQMNHEFVLFTPPSLGRGDTTFLPDGNGVSYYDTIPINSFSPTATYQTNFLKSIFVNMEHSYLGDIEIMLICPNNQFVILKQQPGGTATHLGEPVDPPGLVSTVAGIGYDYYFPTSNPFYNTMVNEAGVYSHAYTDVLGNTYAASTNYLPSGSYTSFQNINTRLTGCPLNGNWVIKVTDNIPVDNGYIFKWGLNFDSLIRPPSIVTPILSVTDSVWWTSPSLGWLTINDSTIGSSPLVPGTHQYTYHVRDNFGCVHDTTLDLFVKNKPKSNAGIDFRTCHLSYQLAPVPTVGATSKSWTYYSPSITGVSNIAVPTDYVTNTVVNEFSIFNYVLQEIVDGCPTYPDTVEITHFQVQNTVDIAVDDDTICMPQMVTFTNNSDMTNFDSIYWEFGDGSVSNLQGSTTHSYTDDTCYDIKITLVNNLGCKVDSIIENLVCAYTTPIADFRYSPLEPIVPETDIDFTNKSYFYTSSDWNFSSLGNSTMQDPSFHFPHFDGGRYAVTLTVSNKGICFDNTTQIIVIKNPLSIFVPNSFTPNKDGLNDKFRIVYNNRDVEKYSLQIFNRWGEEMFSTTDIDFEWDGKVNGVEAPNDMYIWKMRGKDKFDPNTFEKIGYVFLVR